MKNFTTAIFGKISGSLFSTDIGGRLYKGQAPAGAVYPYAVFMLISDVPDKTFTENYEDATIQFSLFSSLPSSLEVETMFTHLKALYDECDLTITGETLVWMKRQNATLMVEEHTTPSGTMEVWHYVVDYSIYVKV